MLLFSEQREKSRLSRRPFFGRSDVREARGLEFVDHDARRDAMSAAIGGHTLRNLTSAAILEVDDGQPSARFQRRDEALVERVDGRDVVIDVAEENRIAARVGQIRRCLCAFDHAHVRQTFLFHVLARLPQRMLGNVGREHTARADPMPEYHCHRAEAGTDIGHGHAGLQLEHFDELGRIQLGLLALLRDLGSIGLLGMYDADCAEDDEDLERVPASHHGE